jgi:hypothetical protein
VSMKQTLHIMKNWTLRSSHQPPPKTTALLVVALNCLTGVTAQAEDNSAATAAALKVLIAPLHESSSRNVAGLPRPELLAASGQHPRSEAGSARSITQVQRGEGLDAVIRRTLPGLPLKEDFLRRAFMRVNPEVYPTATLRPLRSGTTLQVPSTDELRQMFKEQGPVASALLQNPSESGSDPEAAQHAKALDKRRWVRFP